MKWTWWIYQAALVYGMAMLGQAVWRGINALSGKGHFNWDTTRSEIASLIIGAATGLAVVIFLKVRDHEH